MEQRGVGVSGDKEEVDKSEEEEEDAVVIKCRKSKLQILCLSWEVNDNARTQQSAREQEGAIKGSGATRDMDVSGQVVVA